MTGSCGAAMLMAYLPLGTRTILPPATDSHHLSATRRASRPAAFVDHRGWTDPPRCAPPSSSWSTRRPTGCAGDACELTEIGAVLVGGGELHERWETLARTRRPLSRGIQRFTGITQEMVDRAPAGGGDAARAERAAARPRARRAQRRVRPPRARPGVRRAPACDWPDPPALCTVALARRLHPLARQRKLGPLAAVARDRAGGRAPRARRRGDLRARLLRALPAALRERADARGRARAARSQAARAPALAARPTAGRCRCARAAGCPTSAACATRRASTSCATRWASRSTSASRCACARACAPTSRRRRRPPPGRRARRRSSTCRP